MYNQFAALYDELMEDIPYENYLAWVSHESGGLQGKRILDLGCGTGTLSIGFAHLGANVTGVDLSAQMIEQAVEKAKQEELKIHFIQDSMTNFKSDQQFDIVIIAVDSLNYLKTPDEVNETLSAVYKLLSPGGQLFFDVHTPAKIDMYLEGPFIYDDERISYMWSTEAGDEAHSVYHDITFFVQEVGDRYVRFDEHHYQRTYPELKYTEWLKGSLFKNISVYQDIFGEEHMGLRTFFHAIK